MSRWSDGECEVRASQDEISSSISPQLWSSRLASHLAVIGAAVGLGSIWRFPYLAGTYGGGAFVLVFMAACFFIATPLLVAELALGRATRRSPPLAAGEFAADFGRSRYWNAIGILGTVAAFLILSYYTVIAGWVLYYVWLCVTGALTATTHGDPSSTFDGLMAHPCQMIGWHLLFLCCVLAISAGGIRRGIEAANRIRAPAFLALLIFLAIYACATGDPRDGLRFALWPNFGHLSSVGILAAVGQAFFATGVGMAMMIAYGAYIPSGVSLVRSALLISVSIIVVSLLATLMIFPLVFAYGVNPAQGPDLVFKVLPALFATMPAGRWIGAFFFLLLFLAALTPSVAGLEPSVAWAQMQFGLPRPWAAVVCIVAVWFVGLGSVLSFNLWSQWHPLQWVHPFRGMTLYTLIDFVSSNLMLPVGAVLTSALVGWLCAGPKRDRELAADPATTQRYTWTLLRYVCPIAIFGILVAGIAQL
jgi:NSS family neurotransmitter:Na+ symporter